MVHVALPSGTPSWILVLAVSGALLIGVLYGLVRLVRAALPDTSDGRVAWWRLFWEHRRILRRDRWRRHQQRHARRHSNKRFESKPRRWPSLGLQAEGKPPAERAIETGQEK